MSGVSLVLPVLNAARTLPVCLEALARLDPAPAEILLVDNGSSDGSLALLHAFAKESATVPAHVLEEPRRGAAAARNAGIQVARGDLVAFTDADCTPEAAWLRHLTEPFAGPIVGAVAGRVLAARPVSTPELFSALYTLRLPDRPARHRRWTPWEGGFPTANLCVRRALLAAIGGFDPALEIYGEDYDLCARLYSEGAEIAYAPAARVAHHHRTSVRGMLRQAFGFGRAHPNLLRRHGPGGLWLDLPGRSMHWDRFPVRAWVDLAAADKKALAILAAGGLYGPILWLLPLYVGWLAATAARRARGDGLPVSAVAALELAGLLLLKSAAMTAGRWRGSVTHGALCL